MATQSALLPGSPSPPGRGRPVLAAGAALWWCPSSGDVDPRRPTTGPARAARNKPLLGSEATDYQHVDWLTRPRTERGQQVPGRGGLGQQLGDRGGLLGVHLEPLGHTGKDNCADHASLRTAPDSFRGRRGQRWFDVRLAPHRQHMIVGSERPDLRRPRTSATRSPARARVRSERGAMPTAL